MSRLAIATCAKIPNLFAEESRLPAAFKARGLDARAVVWNDPSVDWRAFDAVLVRSTWDYVEHEAEFRRWLGGLESLGVRTLNPPALVRWNLDKSYLARLAAAGACIVPTVFLEKTGQAVNLAATLKQRGWSRAVLKPMISAGAYRTIRFDAADAEKHEQDAEALRLASGALLQPYLPEIETSGELSFFFFGTESRAPAFTVVKKPVPGDFRVQHTFGGTFARVEPTEELVRAACGVIERLPSRPVYARVDGVVLGGQFHLMEVELIEPYLFFAAAPEMMERFVDAVLAAVGA